MKKDDCIFCKIANGEIPSDTVYEDAFVRAVLDLNPAAKGHTLVIPKEHYDDALSADPKVLAKAFQAAALIGAAAKKALSADGINIVQNNGAAAGQTVSHLHVHIIPRKTGDGVGISNWVQGTSDPEEQKEIAEKIGGNL